MGFVRQQVNNKSTFTTGTEVESISNPTFNIWDNKTTATTFEWDLNGGWKLIIDQVTDQLSYQFKGTSILSLSSSGYNIGALSTTNFTSEPDADSYTAGTLIRLNNELYVNVL